MPLLSVIIPVYNVEKYLSCCIASVLSQTFTDFECILVDDGSTDNSPAICDEYSLRDSRIKVIHKPNKGVSSARNAGLETAQGEWIAFVDSDDWVDKNWLGFMLNNALKYNLDVSICGVNYFKDGFIINENKDIYGMMLDSKEAILLMFDEKVTISGFPFNKLYKKQLVKRYGVRFDEDIKYMEDIQFCYKIFKLSDKIYYSSQPCYYYRQINTSATNKMGVSLAVNTAVIVLDSLYENEYDSNIKEKIFMNKIYFMYEVCVSRLLSNNKDLIFISNINYLKNNLKKNTLTLFFRIKLVILLYFDWIIVPYLRFKRGLK